MSPFELTGPDLALFLLLVSALPCAGATLALRALVSRPRAEPPERARVRRLARVARALRAPLVSEHVAFSRARGLASPHFLPVPHTRAQLAVLVEHVRRVAGARDPRQQARVGARPRRARVARGRVRR